MREFFGIDPSIPPMPTNIKGNAVQNAMFMVDAYGVDDGKRATIRTQAAPIFATTMTDAFVVLDVVP